MEFCLYNNFEYINSGIIDLDYLAFKNDYYKNDLNFCSVALKNIRIYTTERVKDEIVKRNLVENKLGKSMKKFKILPMDCNNILCSLCEKKSFLSFIRCCKCRKANCLNHLPTFLCNCSENEINLHYKNVDNILSK